MSLAHHGILFLDEMPEFERRVLDALRQPVEEGRITVSRAARSVVFPAQVMLVAAMNPCPCGYAGSTVRVCRCTPAMVARYRARLSGPLRDRLDLVVEVEPVPVRALDGRTPGGESSAVVRQRVLDARQCQSERQRGLNARLSGRTLSAVCALDGEGQQLIERSAEQLHLSARAYHRVLRVARTVADLAALPRVLPAHLAEALQYRLID